MARHPDKEMLKSWKSFDTSVKLAKQAHNAGKTARFRGLLNTLETCYYKFEEDFEFYKQDAIEKCGTVDAFNSTVEKDGVNAPLYSKNDSWAEQEMVRYVEVRDLLEDILDQGTVNVSENAVSVKENVNLAVEMFKTECTAVRSSTEKLKAEIEAYEDKMMPQTIVASFESIIDKIKNKIAVYIKGLVADKLKLEDNADDVQYSHKSIIELYGAFSSEQTAVLDTCSIILTRKSFANATIEPKVDTDVLAAPTAVLSRPYERIQLEKTKPPKFNGNDVDFPEFKRKWGAQVTAAHLPEETELDKLRDSLPKDAKDQLYGVTALTEAWTILTKRYGDKNLISKKLKHQLKSIQADGKNDSERVINLKIKVRNIVTRLTSLGMEAALTHDAEFLSAVYCALPDRQRTRWLDSVKTEDHWEDMLIFLDKAYEQANEEIVLLSVMDSKDNKKHVKSSGIQASSGASNDGNNVGTKAARDKAKEACGKCPICQQHHTWTKRNGTTWPSDRFISCRKFSDMNVQQRSNAIQAANGCPRCTCWRHQRQSCRMPPNSCNEDIGGGKCSGDHSKLLHGTTNVYCAAISANLRASGSDLFACVKEDEEAIFYLQDIPVRGPKKSARVFWDQGSNRVLIRDDFAKSNRLIHKDVTYTIDYRHCW